MMRPGRNFSIVSLTESYQTVSPAREGTAAGIIKLSMSAEAGKGSNREKAH